MVHHSVAAETVLFGLVSFSSWCVFRINFLKYTPAPKNMDYLQRSEVFRMLHETEEPKRGIAARPGKIAAEEDYYQDGGISLSLGRQ